MRPWCYFVSCFFSWLSINQSINHRRYLSGDDEKYWRGEWYVGIKDFTYDDEFSKYLPDEVNPQKQKAVLDSSLSLQGAKAQDAVLDFCDKVEAATCVRDDTSLEICQDRGVNPKKLVLEGTLRCFLRDFYSFHTNVFPGTTKATVQGLDEATLNERLLLFTKDPATKDVQSRDDIWIIDDKLAFFRIFARMTVIGEHGLTAKIPLYVLGTAPPFAPSHHHAGIQTWDLICF